MVTIRPVGTPKTNSTNGFELGRTYRARPVTGGYEVILPGGRPRFILADGSGGAHLQHVRERGRYSTYATTAGHFEITQTNGD